MVDGELTLKIDAALAESLRVRAEAAGQSVEDYALGVLGRAVEESGFEDNEVPWNGAPVGASHDNGFGEDDPAIWTEVDAICDAVVAEDNGIPLDELGGWMNGWGKSDGPPPPR